MFLKKKNLNTNILSLISFISIFAFYFSNYAYAKETKYVPDKNYGTPNFDRSRPEYWGATFCGTKEINISSGSEFLVALTGDSFVKYDLFSSVSGPVALALKWPKVEKNLTGWLLSNDVRGFSSVDSKNFVITNYFDTLVYYNKDTVWKFNKVKEVYRTNIERSALNRELFYVPKNYINYLNGSSENIYSNENGLLKSNVKPNDKLANFFLETETYDGLVSRSLFNGEIYEIGSRKGKNLVLKLPNGQIKKLDNSIDAFGYSNFKIGKLSSGQLIIFSKGVIIPISANENAFALDTPFYSKIVNTPNNDNLKYYHSLYKIYPIIGGYDNYTKLIQTEIDKWTKNGWVVKSITTDPKTNKSAILFLNPSNENRTSISFIESNQTKPKHYLCNENAFNVPAVKMSANRYLEKEEVSALLQPDSAPHVLNEIPDTKYNFKYRQIGTSKAPVGIMEYSIKSQIKGYYVKIRGGPMSNLDNYAPAEHEKELLNLGWKLILIEYSGAIETAPSIYSRLAKSRDDSLKEDAKVISDEINKLSHEFPLIMTAESWGSALASYLVENIGSRIKHLFLLVPAADNLDPSEYAKVKGKDYNSPWMREVREIESATYGAPYDGKNSEINYWFAQRAKILCNFPKRTIMFGGKDEKVTPAPWLKVCGDNLEYTVFENAGHELTEEMVNVIMEKLKAISD